MLETVAKPMLQMLEIQRESSTKRIQCLQKQLEQLTLGINDDNYCDGIYKCNNDQEHVPLTTSLVDNPKKRKTEKKSSMVSSPV